MTLFFSESPTNPYLRCVDVRRIARLCHAAGATVCIDSTFATPVNQARTHLTRRASPGCLPTLLSGRGCFGSLSIVELMKDCHRNQDRLVDVHCVAAARAGAGR